MNAAPELLLFFPGFGSGGLERVMLNLAGGFKQQGANVTLLVLHAEGPLLAQVPKGIRMIGLGEGNLYYHLPAVMRVFRQCHPDAILSGSPNINILALLARRLSGAQSRLVISEHSSFHSGEDRTGRRWSTRLRNPLRSVFYSQAEGIVAVSTGVAASIEAVGIPPERIRVVHNPVYTPEILAKAQEPLEHPWPVSSLPVVLAVGRLAAPKDYPTLLHAFAALRASHPMKLVILGEGPERARLEALSEQLGIASDVMMPGFALNPYAAMARASVLALSSAWEGFANVLVEAMACGTPVVSTNCESGPAEILADGQFGRLVPTGDYRALADAIWETLQHPLPRETLHARAANFGVDTAVQTYTQLLLPGYRQREVKA